MSGIEHGIGFVEGHARNFKFVTTGRLDDDVVAQAERRGDDLVIRISASRIRGRSMDDVEQILFHEVAHTAEWRFTTARQWERENDAARRARENGRPIKISRSGAIIEQALESAGVELYYSESDAKIVFVGDSEAVASSISRYAVQGARRGDQDSELMAECIRYVAVRGFGSNVIADVVVRCLLDGH